MHGGKTFAVNQNVLYGTLDEQKTFFVASVMNT